MLDSHLQWGEHVNSVNLEIIKCISIMYSLRDIFTINIMTQLYNSFICPYIDYCLEVWGRTYPSNVNPVYIMQKKAIRKIFNTHYNKHTNNYLIELNEPKLLDLLKHKTGLLMNKANKNLLPKNVQFFLLCMAMCTLDKLEIPTVCCKNSKKTNVCFYGWTKVVEFHGNNSISGNK